MDENLHQEKPLEIEEINSVAKSKSNKLLYVATIICITIGLIGSLIFIVAKQTSSPAALKEITKKFITPTPVPFYELTIPYLRGRQYSSQLLKKDVVSKNQNYTSYLTAFTSDGLKINAQLTIPEGTRPEKGWPAVIFIHGYIPPTNYETLVNYASYVDSIAKNGIAILKIDLRGHGSSEGEPSGAYYSSDYVVDTLNAYVALQNESEINPGAIGIWGHSMAGNIALRALAAKPEVPAAVIWAGAVYSYSDWQKYGISDGSYQPPANNEERQKKRNKLFETHGQFSEENPFWRTVTATYYLKELKSAIQLNHAVNDDVVDVGYSRDLKILLDANGVKNELNEYPSGGHNITSPSYNTAMDNTVRFFKENLK